MTFMLDKSLLRRNFVVLAGSQAWAYPLAENIAPDDAVFISSDQRAEPSWLTAAQGRKLLGSTVSGVVMDTQAGFDPDLFALVAGSIEGGGVLVLLVPELKDWPKQPHSPAAQRFLTRLVSKIKSHAGVVLINEADGSPIPDLLSVAEEHQPQSPITHPTCATIDQQLAVEKILNVVKGHRRRPLVLTSDRGRGKSSALGIAAAELLRQGVQRIVVTAPRLAAASALFEMLAQQFPDATHNKGRCQIDSAEVVFFSPDYLSLQKESADLLIVDEAAAIPASLLLKLLKRYSRIVFVTTVHGYEGHGRGFAVRFCQILNQQTPGWQQLEMETPIRWAKNDPLEAFVFDALLLKTHPTDSQQLAGLDVADCEMVRLNRNQLAANEKMLTELFGLLVIAHYQTSASDLRQLLDDSDITVYAAITKENHIAATALVLDEGNLDTELEDQIRQGSRRLKGHLCAQTLAAHLGLSDVAELSSRRIMRIAVHPDLQLRGLGAALLEKITADAQAEGMDYLASSFGITTGLLNFWRKTGFSVVKIGTQRNAASANYSGLLVSALSLAGQRMLEQARSRFVQIFPQLLQEDLASLDAETCIALAKGLPGIPLTAEDRQALAEFANTARSYVATLPELMRLSHLALNSGDEKNLTHGLLIMKLLQKRSWSEIAEQRQLTGKSQAVEQLREAVNKSLKRF